VLREAERRAEWLKDQGGYHHVVIELHVLLPCPTPAHKFDGGDDGRGHANMSSPNHYANARDLGGLAGNAAAEVGVPGCAGVSREAAQARGPKQWPPSPRNIRRGARDRCDASHG